MSTSTYTVKGMTCGHCAKAVTSEVEQIPGVSHVDVDVATGEVTLTSETAVDPAAVRAAVTEAGYEFVGR